MNSTEYFGPASFFRPGERNPTIFILRGIPGSGKSSLIQSLTSFHNPKDVCICSADFFRYKKNPLDPDGPLTYQFVAEELPLTFQLCEQRYKDAIMNKTELIVVDNTNIEVAHIERYLDLLLDLNMASIYRIFIVRLACDNVGFLRLFQSRGTHNVPQSTLELFFRMMRPIKGEIVLLPYLSESDLDKVYYWNDEEEALEPNSEESYPILDKYPQLRIYGRRIDSSGVVSATEALSRRFSSPVRATLPYLLRHQLIYYAGLFLAHDARAQLRALFLPPEWAPFVHTEGSHMTVCFQPSTSLLADSQVMRCLGAEITLEARALAVGTGNAALVVNVVGGSPFLRSQHAAAVLDDETVDPHVRRNGRTLLAADVTCCADLTSNFELLTAGAAPEEAGPSTTGSSSIWHGMEDLPLPFRSLPPLQSNFLEIETLSDKINAINALVAPQEAHMRVFYDAAALLGQALQPHTSLQRRESVGLDSPFSSNAVPHITIFRFNGAAAYHSNVLLSSLARAGLLGNEDLSIQGVVQRNPLREEECIINLPVPLRFVAKFGLTVCSAPGDSRIKGVVASMRDVCYI